MKTKKMSLPKLPSHLPPLPKGYVYLGTKDEINFIKPFSGACCFGRGDSWDKGERLACVYGLYYAAPANSEIVALNGGAPKAKRVNRVDVCKLAEETAKRAGFSREHEPRDVKCYVSGFVKGYRAAMRKARK